MDDQEALREHIVHLLRGGSAHMHFDAVLDGLSAEGRGRRPDGLPYSPWELVEHMRLAQWDILEYCRNPQHASPAWPEGFWPDQPQPPGEQAWERSLEAFRSDLETIIGFVAAPDTDLLAPIPHGHEGHSVLREALLVADHNAYHLGQLVTVRRLLGEWQ